MDFWEIIGRTDNILGILTVMFSGYAAYRLWQQHQRFLKLARESGRRIDFPKLVQDYEGVKTARPVAFAMSLLPNNPSIKANVETFLAAKQWSMPIDELNMTGLNNAQDLENFVDKLQEKKRLLQLEGYTEIHLFLAGPVTAGMIVGALFDNWIPVKIYHKPSPPPPEIYEYWMPLIAT